MRRNLVLLAGVATAIAAADLGHKALAIAERGDALLYHERSPAYAAGVLVAAAVWCGALLLTRSRGLAIVGGLLFGGAAGNALSWLLWPGYDGAPNPWFLGDETRGIAFNLADVVVVAAIFVALPIALTVFALRNRGRLREPVSFRGA